MTTTTLRFTPADAINAFLRWRFMGDRRANRHNTFKLPAFSTLDFGAQVDVTSNVTVSLNVNNVLNIKGILS